MSTELGGGEIDEIGETDELGLIRTPIAGGTKEERLAAFRKRHSKLVREVREALENHALRLKQAGQN
jgi:hypothetical protein